MEAGVDRRVGTTTKIVIPVVSSDGKQLLFTNYLRRNTVNGKHLSRQLLDMTLIIEGTHQIYSPEDPKDEMKIWEA